MIGLILKVAGFLLKGFLLFILGYLVYHHFSSIAVERKNEKAEAAREKEQKRIDKENKRIQKQNVKNGQSQLSEQFLYVINRDRSDYVGEALYFNGRK